MKRIKSLKDLPSWFDIKNYDALLGLTLQELLEQLEVRGTMRGFLYEEDSIIVKRIRSGNPILPTYCSEEAERAFADSQRARGLSYEPTPQLASSRSINPLRFYDLAPASVIARDDEIYKVGDDGLVMNRKRALSNVSLHPDPSFESAIWTAIRLDGSSDEEILAELRSLLPSWREQKGTPPPDYSVGRLGEATFKNIVRYGAIPLLDLMQWEDMSGSKISNAVLARVIFSHDNDMIKGEEHLKKTVRPFVQHVISGELTTRLEALLLRKPELQSRRVEDHIAIMEG
ncbi:DUF6387 family protein [Motiliproteus sp. SC1-56]|uniref:DUF6387 family protein n=1 Tax=Motiliproteus sp. SC1-56 TaxID=2799565 RepID=UPI001A8F4AF7|nr:DUF6387 family protein [Motiliproteus sp. SC1-56]